MIAVRHVDDARARPLPAPPSIDRDARAGAILEVIAADASGDLGFTRVLDELVDETWRLSIEPRAARFAPGFIDLPLVRKLRAGYHTYCALGLSSIVCSRRRPRTLQAAASFVGALHLGEGAIATLALPGMPIMFRRLCGQALDRIAVASAFIILIDIIFDDELEGRTGAERVAAVEHIVTRGDRAPTATAAAKMATALVDVLRASSPAAWAAQAQRVVEWADSEVRLEAGDPRVEPRRATIDVSMELLGFAANAGSAVRLDVDGGGFVGEMELRWMQSIARIGQMVDDVLDVEKDLAAGRVTLGATGVWTVDTIRAQYASLLAQTRALLAAAGEKHGPTLALYERTFRAQIRHMAEVLVENP